MCIAKFVLEVKGLSGFYLGFWLTGESHENLFEVTSFAGRKDPLFEGKRHPYEGIKTVFDK